MSIFCLLFYYACNYFLCVRIVIVAEQATYILGQRALCALSRGFVSYCYRIKNGPTFKNLSLIVHPEVNSWSIVQIVVT